MLQHKLDNIASKNVFVYTPISCSTTHPPCTPSPSPPRTVKRHCRFQTPHCATFKMAEEGATEVGFCHLLFVFHL